MKPKRVSSRKSIEPTGIQAVDRLAAVARCTIEDYVQGVSAYVQNQSHLANGPKKAAQIRLSNALARALAEELASILPNLRGRLITEEQTIAGGLRTAKADVSESHQLDGLRLAIELKPINLAVGRAIWNRFGDIRTFAVNIHLKFPFAVVGGVLVIPTYEEVNSKAAKEAEHIEQAEYDEELPENVDQREETKNSKVAPTQKSTIPLIERAIERLIRAGGRRSESDASHLLEGIAVVVYDPTTGEMSPNLPQPGYGLRWDEFVRSLATAYRMRFEN